jgi:6-phosphogluconolactonase (cycloisomerase 2 family)
MSQSLRFVLAYAAAALLGGCGDGGSVPVEPEAPAFAYVFTQVDGVHRVEVHRIHPRDGTLESAPSSIVTVPGATLQSPAMDPLRRALYVWSYREGGVSGILGYTIDAQTGSLTAILGSPFRAFADQDDAEDYERSIAALLVDPPGRFLCAASIDVMKAYAISADGSQLSEPPIRSSAWFSGERLTFNGTMLLALGEWKYCRHPDSFGFCWNGYQQYATASTSRLDVDTGHLTSIKGYNLGNDRLATADSLGRFVYAIGLVGQDAGQVKTFRVHEDGTLEELVTASFPLPHSGRLVAHPSGRFVYQSLSGIDGYSVDSTSGELQPLAGSPFLRSGTLSGLAMAPSGSFLYAVESALTQPDYSLDATAFARYPGRVHAYAIDAETGVLSAVPGSPFSVEGAPWSIEIIGPRN